MELCILGLGCAVQVAVNDYHCLQWQHTAQYIGTPLACAFYPCFILCLGGSHTYAGKTRSCLHTEKRIGRHIAHRHQP